MKKGVTERYEDQQYIDKFHRRPAQCGHKENKTVWQSYEAYCIKVFIFILFAVRLSTDIIATVINLVLLLRQVKNGKLLLCAPAANHEGLWESEDKAPAHLT